MCRSQVFLQPTSPPDVGGRFSHRRISGDHSLLVRVEPCGDYRAGIPDRVIYYQYRHDRARRTLRGVDEQVAKAERAVDGKAPVKRNRFIKLTGTTKSVNRHLEAKARALAGWKGYADAGVMPTGYASCLAGGVPGLDSSA